MMYRIAALGLVMLLSGCGEAQNKMDPLKTEDESKIQERLLNEDELNIIAENEGEKAHIEETLNFDEVREPESLMHADEQNSASYTPIAVIRSLVESNRISEHISALFPENETTQWENDKLVYVIHHKADNQEKTNSHNEQSSRKNSQENSSVREIVSPTYLIKGNLK